MFVYKEIIQIDYYIYRERDLYKILYSDDEKYCHTD